jgi:hypothetical protein
MIIRNCILALSLQQALSFTNVLGNSRLNKSSNPAAVTANSFASSNAFSTALNSKKYKNKKESASVIEKDEESATDESPIQLDLNADFQVEANGNYEVTQESNGVAAETTAAFSEAKKEQPVVGAKADERKPEEEEAASEMQLYDEANMKLAIEDAEST